MKDINYEISDRPISELLQKSDVAFTSNISASAMDAYCYGLGVVSMRDPRLLNKSVLGYTKGVSFVNNAEELRDTLIFRSSMDSNIVSRDYFLLDANLPAWKSILGYEKDN